MIKLLLVLCFSTLLFSKSLYTLDNVKNLNFYLVNKTDFLSSDDKKKIERIIKDRLIKNGFVFGKTDATLFLVVVNAKEIGGSFAINIEIGLAEDVTTHRVGNIKTMAHTYTASELIESDKPYEDTLETIKNLLTQFLEAYKDDNE